jgi:hypothetical protein
MRSTPAKKKFLHHFWLFQPILQFLTLLAVLVILSRCSPLSPSTSKNALDKATDAIAKNETPKKAPEDLLELGLKEIPTLDAMTMGEHDYNELLARGVDVGATHAAALVASKQKPIAEWRINAAQLSELAEKGEIKIKAQDFWAEMDAQKRSTLVKRLKSLQEQEQLKALLFLVAAKKSDFGDNPIQKLSINLDFNIVDDEHALLVVKLPHESASESAEVLDELHKATVQQAKFLAVLLGE